MAPVLVNATMSLDGFVARLDDSPGPLFDWYDAGEIERRNVGGAPDFHLTPESDAYWQRMVDSLGALVVGRTLFDVTDGWGGQHPLKVPVVVLTHEAPTHWEHETPYEFRFVTTGIEDAVAAARELAGGKAVAVAAGEMGSQALAAGLVDEVRIDLVPVVLGSGKPFFTGLDAEHLLGDAVEVVPSSRVIHLRYPVRAE